MLLQELGLVNGDGRLQWQVLQVQSLGNLQLLALIPGLQRLATNVFFLLFPCRFRVEDDERAHGGVSHRRATGDITSSDESGVQLLSVPVAFVQLLEAEDPVAWHNPLKIGSSSVCNRRVHCWSSRRGSQPLNKIIHCRFFTPVMIR